MDLLGSWLKKHYMTLWDISQDTGGRYFFLVFIAGTLIQWLQEGASPVGVWSTENRKEFKL